jgi:S-adenosylmethionine-diacylgycerolhomoserine-N-methlytransferase
MIPDWHAALDQGLAVLAPGGSLHIVDFGDLAGLSWPLDTTLRGWLSAFHVTPREDLPEVATRLAARAGYSYRTHRGPCGYYRLITITRRA